MIFIIKMICLYRNGHWLNCNSNIFIIVSVSVVFLISFPRPQHIRCHFVFAQPNSSLERVSARSFSSSLYCCQNQNSFCLAYYSQWTISRLWSYPLLFSRIHNSLPHNGMFISGSCPLFIYFAMSLCEFWMISYWNRASVNLVIELGFSLPLFHP